MKSLHHYMSPGREIVSSHPEYDDVERHSITEQSQQVQQHPFSKRISNLMLKESQCVVIWEYTRLIKYKFIIQAFVFIVIASFPLGTAAQSLKKFLSFSAYVFPKATSRHIAYTWISHWVTSKYSAYWFNPCYFLLGCLFNVLKINHFLCCFLVYPLISYT